MTPEQCVRFAAQTQELAQQENLPYSLSVTDAEQIEEERFDGKPLKYGTPAAAIAAMERRLADMRTNKAQLLSTVEECDDSMRETLMQDLEALNRQIAETQERLDAYRQQRKCEN